MSAGIASTAPMPPLFADRQEIESFVNTLFRYADEGGFVHLRAFRDDIDGAWRPENWRAVPINSAGLGPVVDAAEALASDCAAVDERVVFASPVATFKSAQHAAERDLTNGLVLTVECDASPQAARERLQMLLGPPTVVVASGGIWTDPATGGFAPKLHLHWRLREPTREFPDHVKLKEARRLAMVLVGADGTAVPPCHPLRWPIAPGDCAPAPRAQAVRSYPPRPTKMTDSRSKNFGNTSVELDAIAPDQLRTLVRKAIQQHQPHDQFHVLKVAKASERRHARGRAGHKCKEKFGASPASHFVEPLRPDDAVRSRVRSRQIAFYTKATAKARAA